MRENDAARAVEAVRRLFGRWEAGEIIRLELQSELVALLAEETIDAVVDAVPEPHRGELLEYFDRFDPDWTDEDSITIHGGTFLTRERHGWRFTDEEWDRIEREARDRDARDRAHFRNVILPAILQWRRVDRGGARRVQA